MASPNRDWRLSLLVAALLGVLLGGSGQPTLAQEAAVQLEKEFTLQVLPLLRSKCFGCHGQDESDIKGELDLTTRHGLLQGGESGDPAMVPGKAAEGSLIAAVKWEGLEMPPKESERLTDAQIAALEAWIAGGAPWPGAARQAEIRAAAATEVETAAGIQVTTSGGTSAEWTTRRYLREDLWAWQPLSKPMPAELGSENPVDFFIGRQLTSRKFSAAPPADPRTLIRRATFDMWGLPPEPAEVDAFLDAWKRDADAAWNQLIERLLASPHYGERWAQHWLDVTRYADTGGMSNDYERSNLWRYRDYVARAFNDDKPYDEFVVEQLAGDELADASVRERTTDENVVETQLNGKYSQQEAEWIVATGFLRLGPWDNAMVDQKEARQLYLDDVVNAVGQTFLSTTLRCVKCHDHKFDPIPTRDYYRFYAAFAATQMAERPVPFLEQENQEGFEQGRKHVQHMLDFAVQEKDKLVAKREAAARAWFERRGLPYRTVSERKDLPDDEKPPRHVGLNHVEEGQLKVREQDEWIWKRRLERYQPMAQSVYNSGAVDLAWNGARKLRIDQKADRTQSPENFILQGGALTAHGDAVVPGVLSATGLIVGAEADDPYVLPEGVSGRRLALARWIAHPQNPLTTRSIVNRIWQYHFGRGLAGNPNNFGAKGAKPTHPELLDYLAAELVDHGWKLKRIHRLILQSRTYRQASDHPAAAQLAEEDPGNTSWAYFPRRRLTAEEVRDAMLASTGELNRQFGGLPALPEIHREVALAPRMIQFSLAPAYQPAPTAVERNRRTFYAYRVRGQADPFLELFNRPNPNDSCELRDAEAVTPQVFTLLNSELVHQRAVALALRLEEHSKTLSEQVDHAFRHVLGRAVHDGERQRMEQYVRDMRGYHRTVTPEHVRWPTEITRSLVEEFSGKPFTYQEILPVFEHYQPDKQAADVRPGTRALADLCLLLFNANEFMFLN